MRPSSSNPSRAAGLTCRERLSKRGGTARHPGLSGQHSRPRRPRPERRDLRRCTAAGRQRLDRRGADGRRYAANHLVGDGGKPLAAFASRAGNPFHAVPSPGKPTPRRRTCTSTTSTPTTDASSNGSIASTASPPRTCQATSAGAAPSKAGANALTRQTGSPARSEMGIPTDNAIRADNQLRKIRNQSKLVPCTILPFAWKRATKLPGDRMSRWQGARENFPAKSRVTH